MLQEPIEKLVSDIDESDKEIDSDSIMDDTGDAPDAGELEENNLEIDSITRRGPGELRKYSKDGNNKKYNLSDGRSPERPQKYSQDSIEDDRNLGDQAAKFLDRPMNIPERSKVSNHSSPNMIDEEKIPLIQANKPRNRERSRDEEKRNLKSPEAKKSREEGLDTRVRIKEIRGWQFKKTGSRRPWKDEPSGKDGPSEEYGANLTIESEKRQPPEDLEIAIPTGRSRGRPRAHEISEGVLKNEASYPIDRIDGRRRGVGRPKKHPDGFDGTAQQYQQQPQQQFQLPRRGRGRPKKNSEFQESQNFGSENLMSSISKDPMALDSGKLELQSNSQRSNGETIENGTPGVLSARSTPMKRGPGRPKKGNKRRRGRPPKNPLTTNIQTELLTLPNTDLHSLKRTRGRPKKNENDMIVEDPTDEVEPKNLEISKFTTSKGASTKYEDIIPEESIELEDYIRKPIFMSMHNNIYGKGEIGSRKLRIASWNLKGIPARTNVKYIEEYISGSKADIFCFHEFKIEEREFIDRNLVKKFEKSFSLYLSCNKSDGTGDLILTKIKPMNVLEGMKNEKHDSEGSFLVLEFNRLYLIAVNFPSSDGKKLEYRINEWDTDFIKMIKSLNSQKSKVIIGDMNVSHTDLDFIEHEGCRQKPGYTFEEQKNFSRLLDHGFVDTFRHFYPEQSKWTNLSLFDAKRRTGYALVNKEALNFVTDSLIMDNVQTGSLCPIELHLKF